ncbi:MAG TPA: hypothetical protein VIH90_08390 [Candidatus Saccharimonadales bacterium]
MTRIVSPAEHNIPGIVTIGRPVRTDVQLSPYVAELLQRRLVEVASLKELAGIGFSGQVQVEAPSVEL